MKLVDIFTDTNNPSLASTSIETTTDPNATVSNPNPNPEPPTKCKINYGQITEHDLIAANYQKLNSKAKPTQQALSRYKNHRCSPYDKFCKVNLSHKDLRTRINGEGVLSGRLMILIRLLRMLGYNEMEYALPISAMKLGGNRAAEI
ncbi:mfs multidrug transporter protein [Rutstroemia sp. NJR-2017a WRK4]|nr:mfs multidrug transporter protein [Rutstroemia sp. NJR-2017a WRK4]